MIIMRTASVFALLAFLATPARAAEPLQPVGKWNVDFGNAHCIATRNYGTAAAPVILALKPSPVGEVMQLSVLRESGEMAVEQSAGTIRVGGAEPVRVSVLAYPGKAKIRLASINLPLADFAPVRSAGVLRIRSVSELDHSFALSQMAPVTAALDRCVAGLRAAWHIGEAAATLSQPARSRKPLRSYFGSRDYPNVALLGQAGGTVGLVTMIDETGKLESCMVTETSGYASLDAQSCAILNERARFDPALGSDGKPAKSGAIRRIRWKIGA